MSYNPASQIVSRTQPNDAYSFSGHSMSAVTETANGLNQLTDRGGTALTYDGRGNMTGDGTRSYAYSSENLLTSSGSVTLAYDPLGRLYQVADGSNTTRFLYDGHTLISEHNWSDVLQQRYVHGPGVDEPIAYYTGSGTGLSNRSYPHQDERGSVISLFNAAGTTATVNRYDEYDTGSAATTADHRLIYDSADGELFYDADGSGSGGAILIAVLQAGLPLAASDVTVI